MSNDVNRIERYCRYRREDDREWRKTGKSIGDPGFCRGDAREARNEADCKMLQLSGCYWGETPLTDPLFCNVKECTQGRRGQSGLFDGSYPMSTCDTKKILDCPNGYRDDGIFVPKLCQGADYGVQGSCPYCLPWDDADMGHNAGLRKCSDPNKDFFPDVTKSGGGYDVWFPYQYHST